MITPAEALAEIDRARAERRDPRPIGEARVRARVTVAGSQVVEGLHLEPTTYEPHPDLPIMVGQVEIECWQSQAEEMRRLAERSALSPREIEKALADLRGHVGEIAADGLEGAARDRVVERIDAASGPELLALITSGRLVGRTSRAYRPSFSASLYAACRRELPQILSVEVAS